MSRRRFAVSIVAGFLAFAAAFLAFPYAQLLRQALPVLNGLQRPLSMLPVSGHVMSTATFLGALTAIWYFTERGGGMPCDSRPAVHRQSFGRRNTGPLPR